MSPSSATHCRRVNRRACNALALADRFLVCRACGNRGPIAAAYLGVILQGAAFLSIGLFASSLTQNQIIAALLAFVILLLLWLADGLSQMTGGRIGDLFRFLSITRPFDDFPLRSG